MGMKQNNFSEIVQYLLRQQQEHATPFVELKLYCHFDNRPLQEPT
jgi:hypothetical protein